MFSLQQNWRKGQNKFCLEVRRVRGEMAQIMYAYIHKGINKPKKEKKKKIKCMLH
jgi:hypothetical protein